MLVFAILTIASVSCRSFEKRYAEAEPGFHNIPSGILSQGYDCTGPNGCPNAGGFEFNTQNIRNQAAQFNQQYNQGSSVTNFSHGKKKRSAKPQFNQQYNQGSSAFQVGSHSQGFDFDNFRKPNVGGLGSRTQNKAGQIAVSRGSSATNIDYYKQIKSSASTNIDFYDY